MEMIEAPLISCMQLQERLDSGGGDPLLIIDTRPYSDYVVGHVKGALTVRLSSLLIRRLGLGRITLCELLVDDQRESYRKKMDGKCTVVAYDEVGGQHSVNYDAKNPLHVVLKSLKTSGKEYYVLEGGMSAFSQECKRLVEASENIRSPSPFNVARENEELGGAPTVAERARSRDMNPTQILPHLYIGAQNHVENLPLLKGLGVGYIINVTSNIPNYFPDHIKYLQIPIKDTWNQNLTSFFENAFNFIEEAKQNKSVVLIHCMAGISRSPTVVIAYVMKTMGIPLAEAYSYVRDKRHSICPNLDFMGELHQYESFLGLRPSGDMQEGAVPMDTTSSNNMQLPLCQFALPPKKKNSLRKPHENANGGPASAADGASSNGHNSNSSPSSNHDGSSLSSSPSSSSSSMSLSSSLSLSNSHGQNGHGFAPGFGLGPVGTSSLLPLGAGIGPASSAFDMEDDPAAAEPDTPMPDGDVHLFVPPLPLSATAAGSSSSSSQHQQPLTPVAQPPAAATAATAVAQVHFTPPSPRSPLRPRHSVPSSPVSPHTGSGIFAL